MRIAEFPRISTVRQLVRVGGFKSFSRVELHGEARDRGRNTKEQGLVKILRARKHGEGVYRRWKSTELPIDCGGGASRSL
jgi:hypothetical protein